MKNNFILIKVIKIENVIQALKRKKKSQPLKRNKVNNEETGINNKLTCQWNIHWTLTEAVATVIIYILIVFYWLFTN